MGERKEKKGKKIRKWLPIIGLCLVLGVLAFVLLRDPKVESEEPGMPVLTVETPQKLSASQREEFTLDVTISDLGQALYPAMSMSLRFDPLRLEFLGVEEGNVFIHDSSTPTGENLPQWSYNAQNSNDTGCINLMYLDITGGKYAFGRDLLGDGEHVLLRLKFRLRGSARAGDVLDLIVEDAVFAASDETQSLAMTTATLGVRNGKLVVGE